MKKQLIVPVLCVFLIFFTAVALDAQPKLKVATITFTANVTGAKVYLNDQYLGETPYANKFPVGSYSLRITADGYDDYVKPIQIQFDTTISVELRRQRQRDFDVSIQADARGATVFIDDRSMGNTPFRGRIRPGQHTVRITADGYEEYIKTIDVNGDVNIKADMRRARHTFTLSIQANAEQAKVSINGQEQNGVAPMDLKLDEGRYTVVVSRRGYTPFTATVDLNRDQRIDAQLGAPKAQIVIDLPNQRGLRVDVLLDGRRMPGNQFDVERGKHTVRVDAGGLTAEQQIDCRPGRVYRLKVVLDLQTPQESDRDFGPGGH